MNDHNNDNNKAPKATTTMQSKSTKTGPDRGDAALGRDVQSKIGHQLRALYDDVVQQGVPDRFAELLNRLDGPNPSGGKRGAE